MKVKRLRRTLEAAGMGLGVNFFLDAWTADGQPLGRRVAIHNLITDPGLNLVRDLLRGQGAGLTQFVLGTGAVAVTAAMAALPGEAHRDVFTQVTVSDRKLTLKFYLGSLYGNGETYTKAGLVSGTNVLFAGVNFAGIGKTSAEAWTFTWEITLADASRS